MPKTDSGRGTFRSKKLFYNLFGALAFYFCFFLLFAFFVRWYTEHGHEVTVPDVKGKVYAEAADMLESSKLYFKIADSLYDESMPPLTVLDQSPGANAAVKDGRTIYLTVNSTVPPQITMPDLIDVSLKQASMILTNYGLKVGKITYKPDLAKDVVLETSIGGKLVFPGTVIKKGDRVDLKLGDGLGETRVEVPNLIGLTLREAKFVLDASSLNLGALVLDASVKRDTLEAVVYRQRPNPNDVANLMMNIGEGVDLFLTSPQDYNSKHIEEE